MSALGRLGLVASQAEGQKLKGQVHTQGYGTKDPGDPMGTLDISRSPSKGS